MLTTVTFGSLFAGIGGIDLGLERTGRYRCRWQVENNSFCQQILAKHWPDVPRYEDIRTLDFTTVPPVDVLVGGFPCQDLSVAGRKKGIKKNETRSGLWYEFDRAICEIKPRGVLVENVQGLLAPHALGIVLRSLAQLGYDAQWGVLSAEDVGAPHLRKRVFICAWQTGTYPDPVSNQSWTTYGQTHGDDLAGRDATNQREGGHVRGHTGDLCASVADPTGEGRQRWKSRECGVDTQCQAEVSGWRGAGILADIGVQGLRSSGKLPTKGDALSRMGGPTHGISQKLDSAWGVGWEENVPRVITGQPHRAKRLRALGNAVVPQCATVVGCYLLGLLGEP